MSDAAARIQSSGVDGPLLVEVGATTTTGVMAPAAPRLARDARLVGHRTMRTVALDSATTYRMGSDLARVGYAQEPAASVGGEVIDELGVAWSWGDPAPAPLRHPLADRPAVEVLHRPRPMWPGLVQVPEGWLRHTAGAPVDGPSTIALPSQLAILDAPCPGILETAFAVRGTWAFLEDLAVDRRGANAVLEWALETVVDAYANALDVLPRSPDLVLVADDYARSRGMLLAPADFRAFVKPRLRALVTHLRARTGASIVLHSCGAVGPILSDLADLEPAVVDLDAEADGLDLETVRHAVGTGVAVHGWVDLGSLGRAAAGDDGKCLRALLRRLAASAPTVAAPADAIDTSAQLRAVVGGSALIRALAARGVAFPDLARPREVPDVELRDAMEASRAARPPETCAVPATVSRHARPEPRRSRSPHPVLEPV